MYYLGGTVRSAEEVLEGTSEEERILRSNVRGNEISRIWASSTGWKFTTGLEPDDFVLDLEKRPTKKDKRP